ncbi:MAG: Rieske 2Fe-2S domain-containing protein [Actinophytocola sp.]|uniref:Rieske 2Fe-2S domain-containing protein n=1 Tax=Actinophytocola sp. TaxID=1872138 RepID=UPI0013244E6E|nr:Rieske 2Fe-2S domain-containing protein [Actinophytocola sp.]MPZ78917.1 Rieske 2Fe-2S domain-containing protein [Actinophytocola sp.]
MNALSGLIRRLERAETLDRLARPLTAAIGRAVRPRAVRNLLSGTDLGHPLHPMLTDLPIGAWGMSALLDAVGGRSAERSADLLMAAGVLAAVPTAAAGLNDWSDTYGADTRVGLAHATINTAALGLYVASLSLRAHGKRTRGKVIGLAGFAVLLAGSYLGGHLSFARGVNVNRTAWQQGPRDWTPVLPDADLPEGEHRVVAAAGVPMLLHRTAGTVRALANTCSHMGGPLDEGTIAEDRVTCPWHGSTFRLADGAVVRGPASSPQPRYETRVSGDRIEVRAVD